MQSSSLNPQPAAQHSPTIRVIKHIDDPFAGLKGHAYIKARNLNKPVKRLVQTSAQKPRCISIPITGGMSAVFDALFSAIEVSK